jgi:hypothetical protein
MAALKAAGCERLYSEKRSGAETDRKALAKLMKEASPGDTVVVTRLDRLARSTRDLLNLRINRSLPQRLEADVVLAEPVEHRKLSRRTAAQPCCRSPGPAADDRGAQAGRRQRREATSPQGRLVVNILASISEFERELIHA